MKAIVVCEGSVGSGDPVRVIMVPDGFVTEGNLHSVRALAGFGCQCIHVIDPDSAATLSAVEEIFEEMNGPGDSDKEGEDE
jgi:hypothetical protein